MCSFTLSPLRQVSISEEGLSLFQAIAAMCQCVICRLFVNYDSICEGKLKNNSKINHLQTLQNRVDRIPCPISAVLLGFCLNSLRTKISAFQCETIFVSKKQYVLIPLK